MAPVGSLGLESATARVSGPDPGGERADTRHGDGPAAGALREVGQRAPAGPRDEQLATGDQLRAGVLEQLGGAVADATWPGGRPCRAAAHSRTSVAAGSG